MLSSLSKKKGINVGNWRVAITLGYYAFIVLGLIGILQTTGLDLSFFTVLTGAIGIGVGFGMQTIFSNFISGIIILLEKPLKLGDRIEVGDVSGNVHNISVRATTIITNDNVSIIVPNSDFISKQVINWSSSGNNVRLSVSVSVAYDSDPDLVEKLLLEVAANEPGVLKSPTPKVRLTGFGESGLNFSLMVWTHDYTDFQGSLKSLLNFSILRSFRAAGVEIPFARRDIRIINQASEEKDSV
jgi:small-conductance mechanosensitive channel